MDIEKEPIAKKFPKAIKESSLRRVLGGQLAIHRHLMMT